MSDLAELIAKMDAEGEGSREFDHAIWAIVRSSMDRAAGTPTPHFTSSIDDAVSLVPGERNWSVERVFNLHWAAVAPDREQANMVKSEDGVYGPAAFALSLAALKARIAA